MDADKNWGQKRLKRAHKLNTHKIGCTFIDQTYYEIEFAQKLAAITRCVQKLNAQQNGLITKPGCT